MSDKDLVVDILEIVFPEKRPFLEGELVRGEVIIDCKDDIVLEQLSVEFCGVAYLNEKKKPKTNKSKARTKHNTTGRRESCEMTGNGTTDAKSLTNQEKYLNQKLTLYQRSSSDEFIVHAGRHSYPFSVQLPYNIPSSLSGSRGQICYFCEATLTRPWQPRTTARQDFTVHSITDLAICPQSQNGFRRDIRGSYGILNCLGVGHVTVRLELDRLAYLPNEKIKIRGKISNHSLLRLQASHAVLYQNIRYKDQLTGRSVSERRNICKLSKGPVKTGDKMYWRDSMIVPEDLAPTGLKGCNLIELSYSIQLDVEGSCLLESLTCCTDVIIGSTVGSSNWTSHMERTLSVEDLDRAGGDTIDTNYFV